MEDYKTLDKGNAIDQILQDAMPLVDIQIPEILWDNIDALPCFALFLDQICLVDEPKENLGISNLKNTLKDVFSEDILDHFIAHYKQSFSVNVHAHMFLIQCINQKIYMLKADKVIREGDETIEGLKNDLGELKNALHERFAIMIESFGRSVSSDETKERIIQMDDIASDSMKVNRMMSLMRDVINTGNDYEELEAMNYIEKLYQESDGIQELKIQFLDVFRKSWDDWKNTLQKRISQRKLDQAVIRTAEFKRIMAEKKVRKNTKRRT